MAPISIIGSHFGTVVAILEPWWPSWIFSNIHISAVLRATGLKFGT